MLSGIEHDFLLHRTDGKNGDGYTRIVRDLLQRSQKKDSDDRGTFHYDPTLLTLAAWIESRNYDRGRPRTWQQVDLPLPAGADLRTRYYTRDVPAHVRWGASDQKRLFILLGSSYSTWQRGTWTNKTVSILRADFSEPHIVAFAGFLTPEFLALDARHPALTAQEPARDLYARLQAAIGSWKQAGRIPDDTRVGLIGYSGGASLVISLLAEDQRNNKNEHEKRALLFEEGGIAFSPVLDLPTSFQVLDQANAALTSKGFAPGRALTQPIFPDFIRAYLQGFTASDPLPYLKLTADGAKPDAVSRRDEIIGRFYREFQVVDLATTSKAHYPLAPEAESSARALRRRRALSYDAYYRGVVFQSYSQQYNLGPEASMAAYSLIESELAAITHTPLYIVFAADDPFLSRVDESVTPRPSGTDVGDLPPRLAEIMRFVTRFPNMRVFAPKRGAHMGYFLDGTYLRTTLTTFFGPN